MNVKSKIAAVAIAACLGAFGLAGCATTQTTTVNYDADVMPYGHAGRYADMGPNGCYGCHGGNDEVSVMMKGAPALPTSHYLNGDRSSQQISKARSNCLSCHLESDDYSNVSKVTTVGASSSSTTGGK